MIHFYGVVIDSGRFQCANNPAGNTRRLVQLMLPNANHSPSKTAQFAVYMPVALAVGCKFCIPKFLIAAGAFVTLWAAVPKTTVHKNYNPFMPEGEIRLPQKRLVAAPTGDSVLPKNLN